MIDQYRLKELLGYHSETGEFTWQVSSGRAKPGLKAGTLSGKGYLQVSLDGRRYYLHRLAWLYVYGENPPETVDHINRNKTDNRISNLRLASVAQNNRNILSRKDSSSGARGVRKDGNKWRAFIQSNGKNKNLGCFPTLELAKAAYQRAARERYGEFSPV